jgi:hypothetical protein
MLPVRQALARCGSLAKLYPAFLLDAGLLDGVQLALELRQLSGHLTIPTHKEGGGPEHDNRHAGCDLIVRSLLILNAGKFSSLRRYGLRFTSGQMTAPRLSSAGLNA